jgi:arylsulfatase A-like enzyme
MTVPIGLPAFAQTTAPVAAKKPMDILFIAVDDLRPSFGAYGGPIKTPSIDRLAARGTTFLRAYCQQAVCSPSRTSLLTGQRPDTTRVYDLQTHFRKNLPDVVTLPQYFKQNGYHAQGMGKIYHNGLDDKTSWSVPHQMLKKPTWGPEGMATQQRVTAAARAAGEDVTRVLAPRGPAWESVDNVADNYFQDGATADKAIETLEEMKAGSRPFFLAVGFSRPHLPFVAPKKYWDMYSPSDIKLPANYHSVPTDGVPIALTGWGELRAYAGMPKQGPVSDEQARNLIRGYYASASYMDAQVGRVLDALHQKGLAQNTLVVLWGDHGWSLGEHGMWCKHTNFEDSANAPLILSVPGQKRVGTKTRALAEFVDVYPTLCEAAGLPIPGGLAGKSVLAVTNDPNAPTKPYAFSQYPRGGGNSPVKPVMGYSLTDGRFRYTEWGSHGAELYDHQADPNENHNLARLPENKSRVESLARALHAAYPKAAQEAERAEQEKRQNGTDAGGKGTS